MPILSLYVMSIRVLNLTSEHCQSVLSLFFFQGHEKLLCRAFHDLGVVICIVVLCDVIIKCCSFLVDVNQLGLAYLNAGSLHALSHL